MARPKQFDRDQVLDSAMQLFWEKGYEATSVHDLVERSGVNRVSLYNEFGNKHELFLAALDRYRDDMASAMLGPLLAPDADLTTIKKWFEGFVDQAAHTEFRACLMMNAAVELAGRDPDIACRAGQHVERMERAFTNALRRAAEVGQIAEGRDPKLMARYLTVVAMGLGAVGRATCCKGRLKDVAKQAVAFLEASERSG